MNPLFKCLVALVVLAPLPIGAVYMWAWSLMGLLIALMMGAWCILSVAGSNGPAVPIRRIWPAAALFGIAVLWAVLQMVPWMPTAWQHPIWAEAERVLGMELRGRISLSPFDGASALLRLLTYAGVFWLALQFCRDRNMARHALYAVAISGAVYAAYGIAVQISGTDTILWFKKTSYFGVLTSTFVNRNSYATYAGLDLLAATACILDLVERRLANVSSRSDMIHRTVMVLTTEGRYFVAGWIVLLTALLLTESRGGAIAAAVGLIALFTAIAFRRNGATTRTRATVLSLMAAVLVLIAVSGGNVADRLAATPSSPGNRAVLLTGTVAAIADHAYAGAGYGAFEQTFRMYRDPAIRTTVARAHNTYLENALELGVPAAAALVLSVAAIFLLCVAGVGRRRRDALYPCLGVAATALVAVHSLFDFSLQIPAVAILFAFLLGLGCAQSWNSGRPNGARA